MNPEDYSVNLSNGTPVHVRFADRLEGTDGKELWEITVSDDQGAILESTKVPLATQGPDRNEHLFKQSQLLVGKLNLAGNA